MRGENEELIKKLSAKLSEEIENLPKDGQDHELRVRIKGNRGNINFGSQTFEVKPSKEPPPAGSDRERRCPQCTKGTWRYTQLCMHCDYDLRRHDELEAAKIQAAREEAHRTRVGFLFFGALVGIMAILYLKQYLPESLQNWAIAAMALLAFVAFTSMKAIEEKDSAR